MLVLRTICNHDSLTHIKIKWKIDYLLKSFQTNTNKKRRLWHAPKSQKNLLLFTHSLFSKFTYQWYRIFIGNNPLTMDCIKTEIWGGCKSVTASTDLGVLKLWSKTSIENRGSSVVFFICGVYHIIRDKCT